ncbi:MAG: isoprenylcysteine carboxylmethyltransferase family protein [Chloroflexi bacterium]|nr:isoprenylcysteine carboxylmethyltransferase family protein [Chloroflexota bacterium]
MEGLIDIESYAYGMWPVVAINVVIFLFFVLSFLKPKKRWEWRSMGMFSAFIIALFSEMYGLPLTIYLLTSILGHRYPVTNPFTHFNGNLWAVFTGGSVYLSGLLMVLGGAAMVGGLIIMGKAWKQIHRANGALVTSGLYRRVRHPQYSGLLLIIIGTFIQWPTIITVVMSPVLLLVYYRLARREEREMESRFGGQYVAYREQVPMFWPRLATTWRVAKASN